MNNPENISNFKYEFDSNSGILFKYYYGLITFEDIAISWEFAISNNIIPKNTKGFILDYRNASFNIDVSEYNKIPAFYKQYSSIFYGYKIAILTESPKDIVIPILVKEKDDGYESRPFTTLEAAIKWILAKK